MYILVTCKRARTGRKQTFAYESMEEIKKEVIKILDNRGWDNKVSVDLRSMQSCLEYILDGDYTSIKYKLSASFKKYSEYRHGTYALIG